MFRIDAATASGTLPTPTAAGTQGYFTDGDPGTGAAATIVEADWLNMMQEELMSLLTAASITPSKTTYNQVLTAINFLIAQVTSNVFTGATTTGSANAQVLAVVSPASGFSLRNGVTVTCTAGFTNTGTTTLNVDATGVTTVKKLVTGTLTNLAAGDITSGNNITVQYNSTAGVWVLQTVSGSLFLQAVNNLNDLGSIPSALANLGFNSGTNWVQFPAALGGYIIQWGNVSTSGSQTISFPTTFPSSCIAVVPCGWTGSTSYQTNANAVVGNGGPSASTSGFTLMMGTANSGSQNSGNASYIAIGK